MIVVFTDSADADLVQIGDYIARDNPSRALTFVQELIDCCERLADAPFGYPVVKRFDVYQVRLRIYRKYLIFYRVGANTIEIIHIMHGAQDYESILIFSS